MKNKTLISLIMLMLVLKSNNVISQEPSQDQAPTTPLENIGTEESPEVLPPTSETSTTDNNSTDSLEAVQTLPPEIGAETPIDNTLPVENSEPLNQTETKTEVISSIKENSTIDTLQNDKDLNESSNSKIQKQTGVISEEELLKSKKKKEPKVKSIKATESEIYIQQKDQYKLSENYKTLKLNDIIEQGLRKNFDQQLKSQKQELNELVFNGVKNAFWLPELKITLTTDDQKISTIKNSSRRPLSPHSTSASGLIGLSLGDYTVFNWGKDYALYLNSKSLYEREKQIYNESKRDLKLDLINSYFSLLSTKNIEKVRQDQLRQTSFVYRLTKEKITIGKTSKQDYYQARSEYLKTQNIFHDAKIIADQTDENIAFQIADEAGTKYNSNESLDYKRLKITLDEALELAKKNNADLLNKKILTENAERSYDVALKDNMPLPKFSINLGAYNKRFGPSTNTTRYETYSNSGNIELIASINTTWSLTGEDGFLNSNKLATSRINREIANKELEKSQFYNHSMIRQIYKTIISLQNQIVILEARLPSLQKTFDTILENYLSGKTKFYDFSTALDDLSNTKVYYEQTKLDHLTQKLTLAKLLGVEDFPGENFEQLAIRIKGK